VVDNKVTTVKEKATETLTNATSTKEEALALEEEIKDALNKTQGKEGAPDTVLCQISNSRLFPNWLRTKYTYQQSADLCCTNVMMTLTDS